VKDPQTRPRFSPGPVLWACLIYILGLALAFFYVHPEKVYIETENIQVPEVSLFPVLGYFLGVVAVVGLILFFIPVNRLRLALKVLFGFFYAWGVFIILALFLPSPASIGIAAAIGIVWFIFPFIWLQNLLLLVTLVSIGAVFGAMISPWTVMYLLLALSVYDVVAVFAGYMMWLAKKLSEADTLPAFILPGNLFHWGINLKGATVQKLFVQESAEREFSLLGGGDIGFPLVFVVSVFFAYNFASAILVAGASLIGLVLAYILQIYLLKGKPMPALPPISLLAIAGFLIVHFLRPF